MGWSFTTANLRKGRYQQKKNPQMIPKGFFFTFVGNSVICLDKMKSEAWKLTALWKDKHKEAHLFKKLWKLQTLVKKLRTNCGMMA